MNSPEDRTGLADPPGAVVGLGRRFWAFWAATTLSGLGNGCNYVALPLLAAHLTQRPILVAGLLFAEKLPWLVVAVPAGAYVDRCDRPRLMRRMDMTRGGLMVAVAVLVATRHMTIELIYVSGLALGVCDTFFAGSTQATLPDIVGDARLDSANGLLVVGSTASEDAAGPAIGGLLYSLSRFVPFAGDAVSFFGSAALLLGLGRETPPMPDEGDPGGRDPEDDRPRPVGPDGRMWADIRVGMAWYRQSRALCLVTATVAVLAFSQAMVAGILVLFVLQRLHLHPVGYGIFMACMSLGAVAGGAVAARVLRRIGTAKVALLVILLAGVAYLGAGSTSSPYIAAGFLGLEAVAVTVGNVATITFRQRVTPGELQARIANVWRSVVWGVVPLGVVAGGALASALGLRFPFYAAGGLQLVLAVVVARPLRRLIGDAGR